MTIDHRPVAGNPASAQFHPISPTLAGPSPQAAFHSPPLANGEGDVGASQPITARFSPARPCPVCGTGSKGCSATGEGLHLCRGEPGDGWRSMSDEADDNGFRYYRLAGDGRARGRPQPHFNPTPQKDWHAAALLFVATITPALRAELAAGLLIPVEAIAALPLLGWSEGEHCWTFAEQDAAGGVIGITRRFRDGRKRVLAGGHRGLILAAGWRETAGPVFVVEGASDVLATTQAGLPCVGRPSSTGGAHLLAALLAILPADRQIVVVGENDAKDGGGWPGRDGMRAVAGKLAASLRRPVLTALPPAGVKDVRGWLTHPDRGHTPWRERGRELSALLLDDAAAVDPPAAPPPSPSPPSIPEYVPFPVECLPEAVEPFVRQVAAATNTDPAFTALPLLSLLGAIVGATRAIVPKQGWPVFPTIWACCIGRSASGKSPALRAVMDALAPLIEELDNANRAAHEGYERAKSAHFADRSKRGVPPPQEPPPQRVQVGDTTVEALAAILHHNPRGVWLAADELAGWFDSFTKYKSGRGNTDRPKWLSLFDSGCLMVDRKGGEPKHVSVRNTMVGVAGGIQPAILRTTMTEENVRSGLFARILLAYPLDRPTQWSQAEVTEQATDELTGLLRALREYGFAEQNGRRVPVWNTLHSDAKALFIPFYNANRRQAFTADDAEAAAAVKLEAYALRFAHLRHLCRHAGGDDSTPVSAEDMAAGIALAGWFRGELQRVRALLAEPEQRQGNRRLAAWIHSKGGAVTVRELQKTDHRRYPKVQDARARLEELAADGFGEWADERAGNGRTVTRFVLHPDPAPDARHYQTPPLGVGDIPDAVPAGVGEAPDFPDEPGEASGSVWRRDGEPTPGDNNRGQTPSAGEASAATGGAAPRPVWSDADQFSALASRAGVTWPAVLGWLNERHAARLTPDTGFFRVPAALRSAAADWLERLAQDAERA